MPRPDFLRPLNFFFFAILAASGYLVSSGELKITGVLAKIVLSMLFLTISANIFNEFSTGKIHGVMKIFHFRFKKRELNHSVIASLILFFSGFLASYSISLNTSFFYISAAVLLVAYLSYFKNVRFMRSIVIGAASSVAIIMGSGAYGYSQTAYLMAILLFFSNAAGDMIKSITDETKDRATFLVNFLKHFSSYVKFDANRTRKASVASLVVFIILSPMPYVFGLVSIKYLIIITISSLIAFAALFSIIKEGKNTALLAKADELIKINMLVSIIAFLAGSFL
ncbi:MAG: UbiA family prenyltransferase [Candidatus Aenigmarchaeota archaeon]|nr:UbiA family prenyltransferase [Candidatus Aenigmarchaeota archaeon]